jgi:very-short-patch-repair endonuclease
VHNRARLTRRCAPGCAAAPRCLQYEVVDGNGDLRRLDFAWPRYRVAVEYDGLDWHSDPDAMRNDRKRQAALADLGWVVISVVFEDVRYRAWDFVARVNQHFGRTHAA